ncbi:ABC transporter permease subunit [Pelagibius litoralis]|uniref:ABC transporter permease subunit n=1 Tax=Pelagibius litoralis TaxID=374515 RepID=A0A967F270_9PROT|nr:ABC transporter permease subunit [Pelagibius litoralis]NIA71769.1 ABC transporter permease subunit [Pelagibius litoralis]
MTTSASVTSQRIRSAASFGLSNFQKMRLAVLSQAIRRILPAMGKQFVYMLKMSSLVCVLGLSELTRRANELSVTVYRPLETYTILLLEYLALVLVVSWLVRRPEKRMGANVPEGGC